MDKPDKVIKRDFLKWLNERCYELGKQYLFDKNEAADKAGDSETKKAQKENIDEEAEDVIVSLLTA